MNGRGFIHLGVIGEVDLEDMLDVHRVRDVGVGSERHVDGHRPMLRQVLDKPVVHPVVVPQLLHRCADDRP